MSRNSYALNELQAGLLLAGYGIPVAKSMVIGSEEDLHTAAEELRFPVVMKILSADILHKSDAGCVKLNITDSSAMEAARLEILENAAKHMPGACIEGVLAQEMKPKGLELLFGMKRDPQFGPVLVFGLGGIYVELLKAVSMRLLPLENRDAITLVGETPLGKIFEGARGETYNKEEVISVMLGLSRLVGEHPEIAEIDINPFIVYGDGRPGAAVDAVVICNKGEK